MEDQSDGCNLKSRKKAKLKHKIRPHSTKNSLKPKTKALSTTLNLTAVESSTVERT